jgi:hypothetical protein
MPQDGRLADGRRLLMIAQELVMSLFALLHAFPHVPTVILEDSSQEATWYSVVSLNGLHQALLEMLQNSLC